MCKTSATRRPQGPSLAVSLTPYIGAAAGAMQPRFETISSDFPAEVASNVSRTRDRHAQCNRSAVANSIDMAPSCGDSMPLLPFLAKGAVERRFFRTCRCASVGASTVAGPHFRGCDAGSTGSKGGRHGQQAG